MTDLRIQAEERATRYLSGHTVESELGSGKDGFVFSTSSRSAVKTYFRRDTLHNELAVYERLRDHDVDEVDGFAVPQLRGSEEALGVIEMTIVQPPFVLDFAGSYLDFAPEFPPEVIEEWDRQRQDWFGERWPIVLRLIRIFEGRFGIFLDDITPRNVRFDNEADG